MKVKIYGENSEALVSRVKNVLDELGLVDFIELEETTDEALKNELWIKDSPALVIEEESIDFKDVIFEWMTPEEEELKSMFVSIIWGSESDSCGSGWCGSGGCGTWCSC